ncbi:MAG TPA: DUF2007 domain-containing protein [Polyangia bacterium]|nr:DUF2007 domain-containing protein [Polyangia bacterium]
MAADGFTTVHVTTDPVEAEMLAEALRGEAIEARVEHVNSALLGVGPQLFEIRLLVADASVAQARAILEDLRHPALVEELSAAAPERGDASVHLAPDPRKAAIGLIIPGGGHACARRPGTALLLGGGVVYAFVALFSSHQGGHFVSNFTYATMFAIIALDVAGGWLLLRAEGRAQAVPVPAATPARQAARGVALLAMAAATGGAAAALVALPAWLRAGDLESLVISCTDREVTVSNAGPRARYVSVDRAGVTASAPTAASAHPVGVDDVSIVRVEPGAKIVRGLSPELVDLERCRRHPDGGCTLRLHVTVQEIASSAAEPAAVEGRCAPDWSGAHRSSRATLEPAEPPDL